jgi:hypothetical protein
VLREGHDLPGQLRYCIAHRQRPSNAPEASPLTSVALGRSRFAFIPYSRDHITRHPCGQCPPAYGLVWVVTAGTTCAHVSGQPMMSARSTGTSVQHEKLIPSAMHANRVDCTVAQLDDRKNGHVAKKLVRGAPTSYVGVASFSGGVARAKRAGRRIPPGFWRRSRRGDAFASPSIHWTIRWKLPN